MIVESVFNYLNTIKRYNYNIELKFVITLSLRFTPVHELKNNLNTNEFYFKVWEGFYHEIHNEPERDQVMRYVMK